MDKRGVSPLIATILLVGIAVTLAVVLSTFIQGLTKKQTEDAEDKLFLGQVCINDVNIDYRSFCFYGELEDNENLGFYNAKIKIEIRNNAEVPIEEFSFKIMGKETRVFTPTCNPLPCLNAYKTETFDPPAPVYNYYGTLADPDGQQEDPPDHADDEIRNIEMLVKKKIDYKSVSGYCDDDEIPINFIAHCPPP